MKKQELRQKIDSVYTRKGRLSIKNKEITISDEGWEELFELIKEDVSEKLDIRQRGIGHAGGVGNLLGDYLL